MMVMIMNEDSCATDDGGDDGDDDDDDDDEDEMILHTTLTQIRVQAPKDAECFEFTTIFESDLIFSASNFEA